MMFRKALSILLTLLMAVSLLVACGKTGTGTETESRPASTTGTEPGATTEAAADKQKYYATDEPITLTLHHFHTSSPWSSDMPVAKALAEVTGITLESSLPSTTTDGNEAYNLMMASGELADIVKTSKENIVRDAQDGAYIPLNDLIEQHAPNLKRFYEQRPDVKRAATAYDGNIYCIPFVPDGEPAEGWFIRKDWLDKLGLEVPKTLDDFYNVLVAFRTRDPNGNGDPNDEVPLFYRGKYNAINIPANLYGMSNEIGVKDGRIYYGAYEPEAIDYYAFAAKLYAEKLLDQEIFTRSGDPRNFFLIDNDTGGVTHDWFGSTAQKAEQGKEKYPHMEFISILPPAGHDGVVREFYARETVRPVSSIAISYTNPDPVATIKLIDYFYTEEGRRLLNYGIEGVHYDMIDGKPIFRSEMLHDPEKSCNQLLWEIGAQHEIGIWQDYDYELQWMTPEAREYSKMYLDSGVIQPMMPKLDFNQSEQDIISNIGTLVSTTMQEYRDRFILGNLEVTEANMQAFRDELKRIGIEDYIRAHQTAYDRYMSIK